DSAGTAVMAFPRWLVLAPNLEKAPCPRLTYWDSLLNILGQGSSLGARPSNSSPPRGGEARRGGNRRALPPLSTSPPGGGEEVHRRRPAMPRLIRGAVLSDYVEVARSVGLDPYRLIAEFRLPPASLTDPDVKVSAAAVGRLLDESARRSGQIDFGLRLADRRTLANLGALALLVREQPTIRKALDVLVGYMFLHSESLLLNMQEQDGQAIISLAFDLDRPV